MKIIFLLFFFFVVRAELVVNATVGIIYDSHGGILLDYESGYVNQVLNYQSFKISSTRCKATFEINDHEITLIHYFPLPARKEEANSHSYSAMFNKLLYIGIFRGANRKDPTKCTPVAKAREYVRFVELGNRLWSANQVRIAQGKDLYISSKCLVIDESIYSEGYGKINNALSNAASAVDKIPALAVRWFITDDYKAAWSGLAVLGSPGIVANKKSNYWLVCKYNPGEEDPHNGKLSTIIHEFGHSCGFNHGGTQGQVATGTFTTFNPVDNYYDCANFMSNCATWDRTITASQYWQVVVGGKPEPWYFKYPESGIHKYRLYAFDHPYSRYFLGSDKAFHNDTEVFDGIEFGYSCLGIRILVNDSLTTKYTGSKGTSGSIMLEYKFNPAGQQSSSNFGIRITYGYSQYDNLLTSNLDHLQSWGDSEIIPGVDYYPSDFDSGTLRIRVLKIHRTVLKESLEKEIVKENKRNYDEPSYADLEIEFYPNKKHTIPSPPKDLPNFIFSPSYFNCEKNKDKNGYICYRSTTSSGWYYFINNGNRDKNIPRLYTVKNVFIRGRNVLRSYNGYDLSKTKVCYGESGSKCVVMSINITNYSGVSIRNYQNAEVNRTKIGDVNATIEDLGNVNLIYGNGLEVPEGGKAYITDLFGNEKDIKVVDKVFVEELPVLETDGIAEGAVVVKNKDGKVIYYNGFTIYNQENGNRVAIEYSDNGKFEVSPAVMPSNKYFTTTSMLYSITVKANNWYYYPILNLRDNDYVLIDFRGKIPSGLKITVETDMGEYTRDLSDLGGLSSVSYKLTFKEVNSAVSSWGEVDRIKFNKDVQLQNIRPIYVSKVGDQIENVNAVTDHFNFDGYKYTVVTQKREAKYIYNKISVEINGNKFSFDSPTSKTSSVDIKKKKGVSGWIIAVIVVVVIVVIIAAVCIIKKKMKK